MGPSSMKLTLRTGYQRPRFPVNVRCLVLGKKCVKLVDGMYKLQVLMMHNSLREESRNDTDPKRYLRQQ